MHTACAGLQRRPSYPQSALLLCFFEMLFFLLLQKTRTQLSGKRMKVLCFVLFESTFLEGKGETRESCTFTPYFNRGGGVLH